MPQPSLDALAVADALMREFPCITHGITIPSNIPETREWERKFFQEKIACVVQGATAGAVAREMERDLTKHIAG